MKNIYDKFRNALLTEVIPEVEKVYRVSRDHDSRATSHLLVQSFLSHDDAVSDYYGTGLIDT